MMKRVDVLAMVSDGNKSRCLCTHKSPILPA